MRHKQADMFLWFVGFGIVLGVIYDLLRAFRREIKHSTAAVMLEDVVFCGIACSGCYGIFFWKNNGGLRAFGFIGIFLGVLLYELTVGPWVLLFFRGCFRVILFPAKWLFRKCKKWKLGRKPLTNQTG